MPRISGKARKIAYAILGIPSNESKLPKRLRKIDRVLLAQETRTQK